MKRLLIHGSNTDVGKTAISCGIVRRCLAYTNNILYIKPLQTGTDNGDSDSATVMRTCENLKVKPQTKTLFSWGPAVSPHLAVRKDPKSFVSDEDFMDRIRHELKHVPHSQNSLSTTIIESAGGVLSPGAAGTLQADLYKQLDIPALLVGDTKLGGISVTLTALESLQQRGVDVRGIAFVEQVEKSYDNERFIEQYAAEIPVYLFSPTPAMPHPLREWCDENAHVFDRLIKQSIFQNF